MVNNNSQNNTVSNILEIIDQLIQGFEIVHKCKFTFNDLKPENIMITKGSSGQLRVNLIDFGFAESYIHSNGKYIHEKEQVDFFRGNMLFASVRQLQFYKTSPKDDMIALCYLLIFLLNDFTFPGLLQKVGSMKLDLCERLNFTLMHKKEKSI